MIILLLLMLIHHSCFIHFNQPLFISLLIHLSPIIYLTVHEYVSLSKKHEEEKSLCYDFIFISLICRHLSRLQPHSKTNCIAYKPRYETTADRSTDECAVESFMRSSQALFSHVLLIYPYSVADSRCVKHKMLHITQKLVVVTHQLRRSNTVTLPEKSKKIP